MMSHIGGDDLDALAGSDHASWLAVHRDEAAAAEEWLARVLGDGDDRPAASEPIGDPVGVSQSTEERDLPVSGTSVEADAEWRIEVLPGGIVVARHERSGAVVTGRLVLNATDAGIRLRLLEYRYAIPSSIGAAGPMAPVASIEGVVNEPAIAQSILDSLGEAPAAAAAVPGLRIPPAMLRGRPRSDDFYRAIAALVQTCRENKIAYGPRLAADNHVSEGTVRSWVHEARRRGLLEQTDVRRER